MKILSVLVISFLVVSSLNARPLTRFKFANDGNPQVAKSNDVWEDVKVDFNWLTTTINQKTCGQSQRVYLGCVLAVQTFGVAIQKNLEVIPVQMLDGRRPFFQTERLALIEVPLPQISSAKDAYIYFEQVRKQLGARFLTSSAAFLKTPNSDFELMLAEIYGRANHMVKAEVYVETMSKFLEVSVDPHTSLRPTKELQMAQQGGDSSFVGLGIEFTKLATGLLIKRVIKGSGAALAQLQVGDLIIEADGQELKNLDDEKIMALLRGVEGTTVRVTIQRGNSTAQVSVVRKKVISPVVSSAEVKFGGQSVVYIRLTNFMYEQACDEIENVVKAWDGKNPAGYILDLRNNPGGNVAIAACIGGVFLGNNKVVSYFERRTIFGPIAQPLETKADVTTQKPLSVLINAYSASASELIAGALRDYNRALIVGQTSFGKGSHQGCGPMKNNEALTICSTGGLFFAPSGESNQTVGVVPHVSVYQNKEPQDMETYAQREAQLYLFPLPPKKLGKAPEGKWNQLKAPTACMNKLDLATVYEQAPSDVLYFKDFQLLNALAAVQCWNK